MYEAQVRLDLEGPAGRIEGLHEESPSPRFAALVLHPHPLNGGTMHNHATYQIAKAARAEGGATLRMNFRGVGLSAGSHAGGAGELEDARVALGWLENRYPDLPLFASGMSFGAWVALRAGCAETAVAGILVAGLALRALPFDLGGTCEKAIAAVQAERDEFARPEEVRLFLGAPRPGRRFWQVDGASHLFLENLPAFARAAGSAWNWLVGEA